jgi:hypothetical protein
VFGMIFTVIIALEFEKSLLVIGERNDHVVQTRTVATIALLAICRKVIILDLAETDGLYILSLSVAILALGGVYWLIRDRERADKVMTAKAVCAFVARSGQRPTVHGSTSNLSYGVRGCGAGPDDRIGFIMGHKTRSAVAVHVRPDDSFAKSAMGKLQPSMRNTS